MARRLPSSMVAVNGSAENRAALEGFVRVGSPVGIIGYVDERPAAWCAVAPRTEYYAIVHSRTLPIDEPDDESIWAINCLFVKSGYRGRGLTQPMIEAAVDYARGSGARIVEAYPVKAMPGDPGRGVLSNIPRRRFHGVRRRTHHRTTQRRREVRVRYYYAEHATKYEQVAREGKTQWSELFGETNDFEMFPNRPFLERILSQDRPYGGNLVCARSGHPS